MEDQSDQVESIGSVVETILESICKYCGGPCVVVPMDKGPHYAKLECSECHRMQKWISKPESERYRRPASHRQLVKKFGKGFCEMCLRKSSKLPGTQTLHGHHVDPYSKNRDKELTKSDVWILCTMCHRIVELLRDYMGHYEHSQLPENTEATDGSTTVGSLEND